MDMTETSKDTDGNTDAEAGSSMELSLRLDSNGRTTYDPALVAASSSVASAADASADGDSEHNSKKAKIEHHDNEHTASLDYSSKSTLTNLASLDSSSPSLEKAMDDLLFDCEIVDCGLLPRTFWVAATEKEPRCYLEKLALEVFNHHVPSSGNFFYDPETSGAEWWVQLRPSPPGTGRYSMLATDDDDGKDDMAKSGISFHWDKDEDLRLMVGGSMYIHPHISTVTYLTNLGAPTMVISKKVNPMTGEYVLETDSSGNASAIEGYVSWPKRGKHLSFDGRLLHAAPSDLMEDGLFEKQCSYSTSSDMDGKTKKLVERRHRRVTFLVNIWLNYKPFNVNPFPETMIEKLSKTDLFGDDFRLFGKAFEEREREGKTSESNTKAILIYDGKASIPGEKLSEDDESSKGSIAVNKMKWSMGQKDEESIEVLMPIELIRGQASTGADIAITWKDGVVLNGTSA